MGLYIKEEENGCTVHCGMADYGPMQEDGAEAGGLGCSEMMGTGEDISSGCGGASGSGSR